MHDLELTHLFHEKFGHMGAYCEREARIYTGWHGE
jgi:hypothetical protein